MTQAENVMGSGSQSDLRRRNISRWRNAAVGAVNYRRCLWIMKQPRC